MVAQAIFPLRDGGVFRQESATRGSNDIFQTLLREYGARDLAPRDDTARSDRTRDRVEHDAERVEHDAERVEHDAERVERDTERVARAWRNYDSSREARAEDRYSDSSNERPEAGDIPVRERNDRGGDSDGAQSRAERLSQDVEPATAKTGTQGHDDAPSDAEAPLEHEPGDETAPKPTIPAIAADPALAAIPALGAPSPTQIVDAVKTPAPAATAKLIPANPADTLNTAPRPAIAPGGETVTPALSESEKAASAAAAKASQSTLPGVVAETGIPLTAAPAKRSQTAGQKAAAAAEPSGALKSAATPGKESQAPDAAQSRTDRAGAKTAANTPAPVTDPAAQAETKQAGHAKPVPVPPSLENPGQRTPVAGDTAAGSLKTAASAGHTGQAPTGVTVTDPMQAASRMAGASPGAAPATDRPVPANEVAVHIQRAAAKGENRIRIQLHPAELGQVDVRLKIGADGIVRATIQVERPETLDLMQRDARGLERALQDAGLKTDSGSLSFNLRDNGENGPREQDGGDTPLDGHEQSDAETLAASETETPVPTGGSTRALDIRV